MPSQVDRHTFLPGTPIFREGEPGACAYVIERGSVEITSLRGGRQVRLAVLGERDLFGEMALVDDEVRSATATALEETEVVVVPSDRVKQEMQRSDPLLHLFLRVILERLRSTSNMMLQEKLGLDTGEIRLPPRSDEDFESARDQAIHRLKLEQELGLALERDELALHFQPIVALADRRVAGFEALLRWIHPQRGVLSPAGFVRLAEDTGLIVPIGFWVLEHACRAHADLPERERFYVSVNLSPLQLADLTFRSRVAEIVEETGIDPAHLVLEITESALMADPESARATLVGIRDLGVRLFLDDFGTGYSSLSYLNRFPITDLKLDRSFVAHMLHDRVSRQIVRAVAALGHELGLGTVAEGVEEEAQARALAELGYHHAQGYLFSKPRERMEG